MKVLKKATKRYFDKTANEFCKLSKEVFVGSDGKRNLQLLEDTKNLMSPKFSVKRSIETVDTVSDTKRLKFAVLKLPNEIWLQIMSYLKNEDIFGNLALVSKHFHALTMDSSIVKCLYIKIISNEKNSKAQNRNWVKVVKRSKTLVELNIHGVEI